MVVNHCQQIYFNLSYFLPQHNEIGFHFSSLGNRNNPFDFKNGEELMKLTASSVVVGDVSALDDEVLHKSVESRSLVAEFGLKLNRISTKLNSDLLKYFGASG